MRRALGRAPGVGRSPQVRAWPRVRPVCADVRRDGTDFATTRGMTSQWQIRSGESVWQLSAGSHVLGRSPEAEIPLNDRSASRRHAELSVSDGRVRVRDLCSRNGVVLNGKPIEPDSWTPVDDTDRVTIGSTHFVLFRRRSRRRCDTIDERPGRRRRSGRRACES